MVASSHMVVPHDVKVDHVNPSEDAMEPHPPERVPFGIGDDGREDLAESDATLQTLTEALTSAPIVHDFFPFLICCSYRSISSARYFSFHSGSSNCSTLALTVSNIFRA